MTVSDFDLVDIADALGLKVISEIHSLNDIDRCIEIHHNIGRVWVVYICHYGDFLPDLYFVSKQPDAALDVDGVLYVGEEFLENYCFLSFENIKCMEDLVKRFTSHPHSLEYSYLSSVV
jgi:hypothetical protein